MDAGRRSLRRCIGRGDGFGGYLFRFLGTRAGARARRRLGIGLGNPRVRGDGEQARAEEDHAGACEGARPCWRRSPIRGPSNRADDRHDRCHDPDRDGHLRVRRRRRPPRCNVVRERHCEHHHGNIRHPASGVTSRASRREALRPWPKLTAHRAGARRAAPPATRGTSGPLPRRGRSRPCRKSRVPRSRCRRAPAPTTRW
jgi:hypothetical protein